MARCNTKEKYLTPKQEKALEKFLELGAEPRKVFTKASGESRHILRVDLPLGCITPLTRFYPMKDGSRDYHTPNAGVRSPEALVSYKDGEKFGQCSSDEFVKWLGDDFTVSKAGVEVAPGTEKRAQRQRSVYMNQHQREQDRAVLDREVARRKKVEDGKAEARQDGGSDKEITEALKGKK